MTRYAPQDGVFVSRPPCANCNAAARLHVGGECPRAYRVDSLENASRQLRDALRGGDAQRVFAARGDVQRLLDHRPGTCLPLCEACDLLLATAP